MDHLDGVVILHELALPENRDLVAELDRFSNVMGNEYDGLSDAPLDVEEAVLKSLPIDRIDRAKRLIHQ